MSDETRLRMAEEPFLLRAADILRRRKVLAFTVFTAILVATVTVARSLPDLYRAHTMVLVERQLPETIVRPAVSGELESRLHVIKQEVISRDRLTELMDRFNLYTDLRARGDIDTALEQVRHDIQIELAGPEQVSGRTKTVSFNLAFTGNARETVADVTNAIAEFYVAQNDAMRSQEATRATQFLKSQVEVAKGQLDANERQVEAYTNRHAGELPQQVEMNLATLERLNTQLRLNGERQMRTLDQRDKLFDVPPRSTAPVVTATPTGNPRLEALKRDLAQLEGFPDKHPDVRRLKDEIAVLEAEAASTQAAAAPTNGDAATHVDPPPGRARTVGNLDAELEMLKRDEANLRQTIASVERRLEGVPYRQNEYAVLSRDQRAMREQYESLVKRYEEAQLGASMEEENQGERFRVLETAVAPTGPVAPNRMRLMIMGLFLALLAASMMVLLAEQIDTSFHSVDEVRSFTRVPVLVAIPRMRPSPARRYLRAAAVTASLLIGFGLVGMLSEYVARGNEPLVRLLVRG